MVFSILTLRINIEEGKAIKYVERRKKNKEEKRREEEKEKQQQQQQQQQRHEDDDDEEEENETTKIRSSQVFTLHLEGRRAALTRR
ncbi:hypothetical protein E2C01_075649 [Portunus trituberculatus]|uniref:Uncharacterized protein n=1 Tax=Portunus trituberculatus TaxID=210409 RepID=A0A5B7IGN7_PORTR|nr:hypothetical protein [Portunus trituberculatus]